MTLETVQTPDKSYELSLILKNYLSTTRFVCKHCILGPHGREGSKNGYGSSYITMKIFDKSIRNLLKAEGSNNSLPPLFIYILNKSTEVLESCRRRRCYEVKPKIEEMLNRVEIDYV